MKTTIDLPSDERALLEEYCRQEGISLDEDVRRAVARLMAEHPRHDRNRCEAALDAAFGSSKDHRVDTDTCLSELRREWEREESA